MKRINTTVLVALTLGACSGVDQPAQGPDPTDPSSTSGGPDTTFDHDNSGFNPFDLIDKLEKEGPPRFTSHVHSCSKVRYANLGNVLNSLGVNTGNQTALSAGDLYQNGGVALGQANYPSRIRENVSITTSAMSREFDIFAAAADEVIAAVPTLARCQIGGVGAQLFDANNNCRADGITCIIGAPAQPAHLDFCNITVSQASDVATGKRIAVAALLAAAYTCE